MPLTPAVRLLLAALVAGTLAGLFVSVIQSLDALPLLLRAESIELQAHHHGEPSPQQLTHSHTDAAHPPADLFQRSLLRIVSDATIGAGFAMILCAAIFLHNRHKPENRATPAMGILWGGCGYLIFYFAPGLTYPPRTPAADLLVGHHDMNIWQQQLIWLATVLSTAAGLLGVFYGKAKARLIGATLLSMPLILARLTDDSLSNLFAQHQVTRLVEVTEQHYRYSAHLSNLLFWVVLGVLSVYAANRADSNIGAADPEPQ